MRSELLLILQNEHAYNSTRTLFCFCFPKKEPVLLTFLIIIEFYKFYRKITFTVQTSECNKGGGTWSMLSSSFSSAEPEGCTFALFPSFCGEKVKHSFELTFSFKPKRTDVADVLNLEKLLILSSQFLQIRRDSPRVIFIPSTFSICCGKAFRFPGTLNMFVNRSAWLVVSHKQQ